MAAKDGLDRQARELDRLLTALIKRYQFRDRSQICCEDVTVSQCYVMKTLGEHGSLPMTRLAELMCLRISSLTRVVDQLVRNKHALRRRLASDRRVCFVELTPRGGAVLRKMEGTIRRWERDVLQKLSPADREALLRGLTKLNTAMEARMCCSTA